jgi:membrane-associated phospholipid phosphatase
VTHPEPVESIRPAATRLTVAYLAATAVLIVFRGRTIPGWPWLVAAHVVLCAALTATGYRRSLPRAVVVWRDWHPLVLFPLLYKEVELLAASMGDWRLGSVIPVVESAIFGGQPSLTLSERLDVVPMSEFLHGCYLAYAFLIPAVALYWYVAGRRTAFHELVLLLAAVLFGSYLFFILFPVESPYYRFERLGPPLAGHFFFDLAHAVSSRGGARGGAFPSAHASGAMVLWMVAWRHQPVLAAVLTPLVLGLMVATVFGRFHYAVDTVAGVALALVVVSLYWRSTSSSAGGLQNAPSLDLRGQ